VGKLPIVDNATRTASKFTNGQTGTSYESTESKQEEKIQNKKTSSLEKRDPE
jgi:hypothetical protein